MVFHTGVIHQVAMDMYVMILICLFNVAILFQHVKTMDRMWGRPGAGAPLRREQVDFAKKQKRE